MINIILFHFLFILITKPQPTTKFSNYDHFFTSNPPESWTTTATAWTLEFFWEGACQYDYGQYLNNPYTDRLYIAIPGPDFSETHSGSCGKCVLVETEHATIEVIVVDECSGCTQTTGNYPNMNWGGVDLSAHAFSIIANMEQDYINWRTAFDVWYQDEWIGQGKECCPRENVDYSIWGAGPGSWSVKLTPTDCSFDIIENKNVQLRIEFKDGWYAEFVFAKSILAIGEVIVHYGTNSGSLTNDRSDNVWYNGIDIQWDSYNTIDFEIIPLFFPNSKRRVTVTLPKGNVDANELANYIDLGFQFPRLKYYNPDICNPQCSSHGNCIGLICNCDEGYSGDICDDAVCQPPCSSHGNCINPNDCECFPYGGYIGDTCSDVACYGIISTSSSVCSNHGDCIGPNTCSCAYSYHGDECEHYYIIGIFCWNIPSENPSVCSHHGSCMKNNTCTCDENYYGVNCNTPMKCFDIPWEDQNVCNGNGTCVRDNVCRCYSGYSGNDCLLIGSNSNKVLVILGISFGISIGVIIIVIIGIIGLLICYKVIKNAKYDEFEEVKDEQLRSYRKYPPRNFTKDTIPPQKPRKPRVNLHRIQNQQRTKPPYKNQNFKRRDINKRKNYNNNNINKRERLYGVIKNYNPKNSDELNIRVGQRVKILKTMNDGWCLVLCNNRKGYVPRNFLK